MKRVLLGLCMIAAVSCSRSNSMLINGAGATFPYPIYSKWFDLYHRAHPELQFNYQSIGSGGGIRQLLAQTVDFGASDSPMTDEQLKSTPFSVVHIPTVLGAVAIVYNQPTLSAPLTLSGSVLADIFLGKIKKWNDPQLAALNPGLTLPESDILVTHRSDGSGTSFIFTDYLSKVSPGWLSKVGRGPAVNWPVGQGGKGNEGVTGVVKQTPGAIGYVEMAYAVQNRLPVARLKNKSGDVVAPSTESVTAAAAGATIPEDFRVSITNASGKGAYPISGFTYLLVVDPAKDSIKGKAISEFLLWAMQMGQSFAAPLHYAPLPPELATRVQQRITQLK